MPLWGNSHSCTSALRLVSKLSLCIATQATAFLCHSTPLPTRCCMFCSNLMVVTHCCVWVLQPLAMQTGALNRLSCHCLQAFSCSDGSTVPLCGDNTRPSAMHAEVAELVLLLGTPSFSTRRTCWRGACSKGQPTEYFRCGQCARPNACCKMAGSPQAVGCPYQQLSGNHLVAVL